MIESQYDYEVLQKMFPEQIRAIELPQVPGSQREHCCNCVHCSKRAAVREGEISVVSGDSDHFHFSTVSVQDGEKAIKGDRGKKRRKSALGSSV